MLQERIADSAAHNTLAPRLYTDILVHPDDICAAQALRYQVFCEEYNVTLPVDGYWRGLPLDRDGFDDFCLHVAVRETVTGHIVGYTRVLSSEQAEKTGGFYSEHEFDIATIKALKARYLEIGRTCIRKDYRNGATIAVLWSKVAELLLAGHYDYLFGCASISLADGGAAYIGVMNDLKTRHMADDAVRVQPLLPIVLADVEGVAAGLPPLLKAYTRMGAKICGDACWDPDFNVADVFVLLETRSLSGRYARHFLKAAN